jgi:prepilin-type N-terminal cleavage/methylation domain-containing protein
MSRPSTNNYKPIRQSAFTLVEVMVVVAVIALLAAIVIPNLVKARATSQANGCINNLRKIQDACDQWAVEAGKSTGDHVSLNLNLKAYIKTASGNRIPPCPANGNYSIESVGDIPTCSLGTTVTPAHVLQ